MKKSQTYLPATLAAVSALGAQIAIARRELGWTAAELADRLGVGAAAVSRLENGAPGTAIGTVLEAAIVTGVPLFDTNPAGLAQVASAQRAQLAILPSRIRRKTVEVDDDF
ncbi:MAG: helix-turn-helix transcriptional regulator [Actinomycetota bacterium]|nr:helix-turn-helix transcriptional regulator [Actinomycetota bacterium]